MTEKNLGGRPIKHREFNEVEKFYIIHHAHIKSNQEIAKAITARLDDVEDFVATIPIPEPVPVQEPEPPRPPVAIDLMGHDTKSEEVGKPSRFVVMTKGASEMGDHQRGKSKGLGDKLSKAIHVLPKRKKSV